MLECKNLKKSYGSSEILNIPALSLGEGIYWLQGPNGSGKTSFLRIVAGLLPFNGDTILDGISQMSAPVPYRRLISWADAEPLYPAFLSGRDLLEFYLDARKAMRAQADELIRAFHVGAFLDAPTGAYSSGMTKKLSLILAFLGNPSLIALDEPFVTLDQEAIPVLNEFIRAAHQDRGVTFLLSSHQDLEYNLGSQVVKLKVAGRTILVAPQTTEPVLP